MYFFCLSFSVFTVYTFLALILNESVITAFTYSDRYRALLMSFCIIIMVFVLFFLISSNHSFIKARKKEFSTYALFGMTNMKIGKLLLIETMIVGVATLGIGIGTGIFFSKLIAMILINVSLAAFVGNVAFTFDPMAVFLTVVLFLIIFFIMGLTGLQVINKFELVDLFKAEKLPEVESKGSYILLVFSIILLAIGYYHATLEEADLVANYNLLIILSVTLGTYFFFWGGLPKVVSWIQKNKSMYYKGENLISTSALSHRMGSISTLMGTIAILTAVATTAIATGYTLYNNVEENTNNTIGYDLYFYGEEEGLIDQVYETFEKYKTAVSESYSVELYRTEPAMRNVYGDGRTYITAVDHYFRVYSQTEFNNLTAISKTALDPVLVEAGEIVYTTPYVQYDLEKAITGHELNFSTQTLEITSVVETNLGMFGGIHSIILHDDDFANLFEAGDIYETNSMAHVINFPNALSQRALNTELNEVLSGNADSYRTAFNHYNELMETFGLVCFIGFFMSAIVILMTASLLYFKQVMAAQAERHQFRMLRKIGMDDQVKKKVITKRLLPVFLIPLLVGILHSVFAMKAANTMVFTNLSPVENTYIMVLGFSSIMYVVYAVIYGIFYYITKGQYSRIVG
jgi:putative ABC transport system permease protein